MQRFITLAFAIFFSLSLSVSAQVGIGTATPQSSSILDLRATDKGLLLPRLDNTQRTTLKTALISEANSLNDGMQVYDTQDKAIYFWNHATSDWVALSTGSGSDATTASNGLTESGDDVQLGGTLSGNTSIAQSGYDFGFTGGEVGIGLAAPAYNLHLESSNAKIGVDGQVFGSNLQTSSLHFYTETGASVNQLGQADNEGWGLIAVGVSNPSANLQGNLIYDYWDGSGWSHPFIFTKTGRFGIGNNDPQASFSVGTNSEFRVNSTGDLTRINNVPYAWPSANTAGVLTNDGSGNLTWASGGGNFIQNQVAADQTAGFRINGNGIFSATTSKIMLGTTTTSGTLGFSGEAQKLIIMERNTVADPGQSLVLNAGGAKSGATDAAGGSLVFRSGTSTGSQGSDIVFQTSTGGVSGTTDHTPNSKMILTSAGYLGIGNTGPSQKLEVQNGNILLSNTGSAGEMRFAEPSASGSNYSAFKAQAQASDITYTLPASSTNGVLTNTAGTLTWNAVTGESTTADNGLTKTAFNVQLGGPLIQNTAITLSNFDLTHNLTGTGNFEVRTGGITSLSVLNGTGFVGVGTAAPASALDVSPTLTGSATAKTYAQIKPVITGADQTAGLVMLDINPSDGVQNSTGVNRGIRVDLTNLTGGTSYYAGTFVGGRVGIGTSAPANLFTVTGNVTGALGSFNNASATSTDYALEAISGNGAQAFHATSASSNPSALISNSSTGTAISAVNSGTGSAITATSANNTAATIQATNGSNGRVINSTTGGTDQSGSGVITNNFIDNRTNTGGVATKTVMYVEGQGAFNGNVRAFHAKATGGTGQNTAGIFEGGNVGIGIIAPSSKLHIVSTAAENAYLQTIMFNEAAGQDAGYVLSTQTTDKDFVMFMDDSDGQKIKFATDVISTDAFRQSNTRMTLTQTGSLGIGTSSPTGQVEIVESGGTMGYARFFNNATSSDFEVDGGTNGIYSINNVSAVGGAGIRFKSNATQILSLSNTGNVGVGNITPGNLFTVGASDQFQVNSSGNLVAIKNVTGYDWPNAHASGVLTNNGSGTLSWSSVAGESTTASNGLTLSGSDVRLGGTLTGATTIAQAGNDFSFTGGKVGVNNGSPIAIFDAIGSNNIATVRGINTNTTAYAAGVSGENHGNGAVIGVMGYSASSNANAAGILASSNNSATSLKVERVGGAGLLAQFTGSSNTTIIDNTGNIGIGDASPASLFTVGNGDLFQVNSSGNIVKINNVTTNFPATQGAANSFLKNDGSGNFSWSTTTDNLGNHTATQNLEMAGFKIVNGSANGIQINANGNVGIGAAPTAFDALRLSTNSTYALNATNGTNTANTAAVRGSMTSASAQGFGVLGQTVSSNANSVGVRGVSGGGSSWAGQFAGRMGAGSSNEFEVSSTGDLVKIKNVPYIWPTSNAGGVLTNDGGGNLSWSAVAGESTTASNGLTLSGSDVRLGGTLTGVTSIDQSNFNFGFTNGSVGIGTASPGYKLDVVGDINIPTTGAVRSNGNTILRADNSNVHVGVGAGTAAIGGGGATDENVFVGYQAGEAVTSTSNVLIGNQAGRNATGGFNIILGDAAGLNAGASNILIGRNAGYSTTGNSNTFIGDVAGNTNVDGGNNTVLGYSANVASGSLTNATAIGANAVVSADNSLVLGNNANVGIGVSNPSQKLDLRDGNLLLSSNSAVANELRLEEGTNTGGDHYTAFKAGDQSGNITYTLPTSDAAGVLTSDGGGNLSWSAVAGESTTASNGLTLSGSDVRLGGTLTSNTTTIDLNAKELLYSGNGNIGVGAINANAKFNIFGDAAHINTIYSTSFNGTDPDATAVTGVTSYSTARNYGVYGVSNSTNIDGAAVYGYTTTAGVGVMGVNSTDLTGYAGVRGEYINNSPFLATETYGVHGKNNSPLVNSAAIYGQHTGGGYAGRFDGKLSAGSSKQFEVDASGNIVKINNVTTNFPSTQGSANSFLQNDGSGNLSWASPSGTFIQNQNAALQSADFRISGSADANSYRIDGNTMFKANGTSTISLGYFAGNSNNENTFVGYTAGQNMSSGNANAVFGAYAGLNGTGSYNTYIGVSTNYDGGNGNGNTLLGYEAGYSNFDGDNNTLLGRRAELLQSGLSNATAIGYNAKVNASNALVLGGTGGDAVKVGIGTTTPAYQLDVVGDINVPTTGQLRIGGTAGTTGQVLSINGSGNMEWTAASSGWGFTGNAGLTDNTDNYLGTTDAVALNFLVGGVRAGRIDNDAVGNTFLGQEAGLNSTNGYNVGIGRNALKTNTIGGGNVAVGISSLEANIDGGWNTAVGEGAMLENTNGSYNVAVGRQALSSNNGGDNNVALGVDALDNNVGGRFNVALGNRTLKSNVGTTFNVAIGYSSQVNAYDSPLTFVTENVSVGPFALAGSATPSANTGDHNTAIGANAFSNNSSGAENTALGYRAGLANDVGSNNTFIGSNADALSNNLVNATAIGYNAKVNASNALVLGGTGSEQVSVGIGTTMPGAFLEIVGDGSGSYLGGYGTLARLNVTDRNHYSLMFGNQAAGSGKDYAMWMDDDGTLNFENDPTGTGTSPATVFSLFPNGNIGVQNDINVSTTSNLIINGDAGSPGEILAIDGSGNMVWGSASGGGTLDNSYDFGGPGAGATITADAGAVRIIGGDGLIVSGAAATGASIGSVGNGSIMYFNPNKYAFRAGNTTGNWFDDAQVGIGSAAFGLDNKAYGDYSFAAGSNNETQSINSTAFGNENFVDGDYGFASGIGNFSRTYGETVIGTYANDYVGNTSSFIPADRLFVIGNGTGTGSRSDAFTVTKNGHIGVNTQTDANYILRVNRDAATPFGAGIANIYAFRDGSGTATDGGVDFTHNGIDAAIKGYSYWGNNFSAGVAGYSWLDFANSAGVIGSVDGGTLYGALAFKDNNNDSWSVYGLGDAKIDGNLKANDPVNPEDVVTLNYLTGAGGAILNQTASNQSASFKINGDGAIGNSLSIGKTSSDLATSPARLEIYRDGSMGNGNGAINVTAHTDGLGSAVVAHGIDASGTVPRTLGGLGNANAAPMGYISDHAVMGYAATGTLNPWGAIFGYGGTDFSTSATYAAFAADGDRAGVFMGGNVGIGTITPEAIGSLDIYNGTGKEQADFTSGQFGYGAERSGLIVSQRHSGSASGNYGYVGPLIDLRLNDASDHENSVAQIIGTGDANSGGGYSGSLIFATAPGGGGLIGGPNRRNAGQAPVARMIIDHNGFVGIGTATPSEVLHAVDTRTALNSTAIKGEALGASTNAIYGVTGYTTSTSSLGAGTYGYTGTAGAGVYGQNNSTMPQSTGVLGWHFGTSDVTYGVQGFAASSFAGTAGVYGENSASAGGQVYGVKGIVASSNTDAAGVYGYASSPTGQMKGVIGENASADAGSAAVYAYASHTSSINSTAFLANNKSSSNVAVIMKGQKDGANRFLMTNFGYLGIGNMTSSPSYSLHIAHADALSSPAILIDDQRNVAGHTPGKLAFRSDLTCAKIEFGKDADGTTAKPGLLFQSYTNASSSSVGSGNGTNRMFIDAGTGNVGIGGDFPASKVPFTNLHVRKSNAPGLTAILADNAVDGSQVALVTGNVCPAIEFGKTFGGSAVPGLAFISNRVNTGAGTGVGTSAGVPDIKMFISGTSGNLSLGSYVIGGNDTSVARLGVRSRDFFITQTGNTTLGGSTITFGATQTLKIGDYVYDATTPAQSRAVIADISGTAIPIFPPSTVANGANSQTFRVYQPAARFEEPSGAGVAFVQNVTGSYLMAPSGNMPGTLNGVQTKMVGVLPQPISNATPGDALIVMAGMAGNNGAGNAGGNLTLQGGNGGGTNGAGGNVFLTPGTRSGTGATGAVLVGLNALTSPNVLMEIGTPLGTAGPGAACRWFSSAAVTAITGGTSNPGNQNVCLKTNGWVWAAAAGGFMASSDLRIKNVLGVSNSTIDLNRLMKLKVTDYTFKDTISESIGNVKGLIAQEVAEIFPEAVKLNKAFIPNIYSVADQFTFDAETKQLAISLNKAADLKVGDRVRLISTEDENIYKEVIAVEGQTFTVKDFDKAPSNIFVYGKEVNDFHTIEYDKIFTLGVSAIQELAKRNDNLTQSVDELKAELATQKAANEAKTAELEKTKVELEKSKTETAKLGATVDEILKRLEKVENLTGTRAEGR